MREAGKPQQAIDILVASMCVNRGFELVTRDSDFENIKGVEPSFRVKLIKEAAASLAKRNTTNFK